MALGAEIHIRNLTLTFCRVLPWKPPLFQGENSGFDNVSSTIKARKAGFGDCIDTEDMFRAFFDKLRADTVIP